MRTLALALCALALTGCDAATQIAGDAVEGEARNAVAAQCEQIAQSAGIVAGRVAQVCQCSVDRFLADREFSLDDITRQNIEGIVNSCAQETGATQGTWDDTTPTEEIGG